MGRLLQFLAVRIQRGLPVTFHLFLTGMLVAQTAPTQPRLTDPHPAVKATSSTGQPLANSYRRDIAREEDEARSAARRQPDSADALYALGEILMRRNKAAESLAVLTKAAAVRAPTGEQLRWVGLDYVLLDDTTDAIRWLNEAARISPANPEIWYSLGRAQYTKGTFADAEANFRHTLSLNPRSEKAEDNLGLSLAAQNRDSEALAAYGRAIDLNWLQTAKSEQPLLNRGTLLIHLGQPDKALPDLLNALVLAPTCSLCHEAAAQSLTALGRLPDARAQLEEAVRLDPVNPRFHYLLGRLYKRLGETQLSADELKRSQSLYGKHSTPLH